MSRRGYGNTNGENIVCPLFKSNTENEIRCESHVPECQVTVLKYRDRRKCEKQRRIYCQENWKRCEHYLSWLHMKWED